jgi:hypothetical protein
VDGIRTSQHLPLRSRFLLGAVSLALATAIWMPLLHFLFIPRQGAFRSQTGISPIARQLTRRHLDLWQSPSRSQSDIDAMRINNPEWDFMGRTYLVLSLANMSLREPALRAGYLPVMDRIIDDTEEYVAREGIHHFLMDYAKNGSFVQHPVRSIFIDGEVALMMGARRLIEENDRYRSRMRELADLTADRMAAGPVRSCESYPNECWTFCNSVALAAIRMHEVLDGEDHSALLHDWVNRARERLTHRETGLLCSSYTYDGQMLDGPEGSTIWTVAHCLQIVDEPLASDQYQRARKELRRQCLGFGWAAEWPKSWVGPMDVDSGPVIPIIEVSAGSSGQAFVGAAAFGDRGYYDALATTLMFAGFPVTENGRLRFCASNQVGDAVLCIRPWPVRSGKRSANAGLRGGVREQVQRPVSKNSGYEVDFARLIPGLRPHLRRHLCRAASGRAAGTHRHLLRHAAGEVQ